jgi:hypothetical protein
MKRLKKKSTKKKSYAIVIIIAILKLIHDECGLECAIISVTKVVVGLLASTLSLLTFNNIQKRFLKKLNRNLS